MREDSEDVEDYQAALADLGRFHTALNARSAFVSGVAIRLDSAAALALMRDISPLIKSVTPLAAAADLAEDGAQALGRTSVNRATVAYRAQAREGASAPGAGPRNPSCDQRGEGGRVPASINAPNPTYFAPSRHKADSVLINDNKKVHRLRFRWQAGLGLSWACGDRPGDRGYEMEAMVFPDDRDRWSDGWAGGNTTSNTQANLPGTQLQDDIASGDRPPANPFDRSRYPDFAIVNTSGRSFRYRELYMVNMTTNNGDQDLQDGRVIYSMQPTRKPLSDGEQSYCSRRGGDYDNCQFSTVDLCWAHGRISSAPIYSRRDWGAITGFLTRLAQAEREFPNAITGRKVDRFCDPRPPGSGRT